MCLVIIMVLLCYWDCGWLFLVFLYGIVVYKVVDVYWVVGCDWVYFVEMFFECWLVDVGLE